MRHGFWILMLAGQCAAQVAPAAEPKTAREMLQAHNQVRKQVGVGPLGWSEKLAAQARDWAGTLLSRGTFEHRPNLSYGQNLFTVTGATATAAQVVRTWAAESRNFDYASNRCKGTCGHYTQIVWRNTREVGCAVARGGGREVWVCDYSPPGNMVGEKPY